MQPRGIVSGVRVLDDDQPLCVLGVVLTGQRVPYELGLLGDTEAFGQGFGHLFRRVAVGQHQDVAHMSYIGVVWGSIIHRAIVRQTGPLSDSGRTVLSGRGRRASGPGCQWHVGCWTAMARKTAHDDPLAPVTIAVGQEDLLLDRAVQQVVAAARAADADTDVRDLTPDQLQPGTLAELTSPSLFAERKVVVVRAAQDLSADTIKDVKAYLGSPAEEITLVLLHAGGAKGKGLLDAARKAGAREVACPKMTKPADRLGFVRGEFRATGRSATPEVRQSLVDAIGSDLRELASACAQLAADVEGTIDEAVVARYYTGRAEASSFTVADRAVEGRAAEALEALRWSLATGVAPVMITSALAQGVRAIGKLASAPRGARPGDLARDLGMPPWKIDRVRQQMRGWSADGVATALRAVAAADAGVKGGGDDPAYALEKAVVAIARAARSR